MSAPDRTQRPQLVKPAEGPRGAFGALLGAAVKDPAAARGLILAYPSLERAHRLQTIDAIVNDALVEGIGASAVLASLLPVEEDLEVAKRIADAMSFGGDTGLRSKLRTRAWLAGETVDGGVVLVRPLYGEFVEVLGLAWNEASGITHAMFEPLAHHEQAREQVRALPERLRFEEMPVTFAIVTVTQVLWSHRRMHGGLPECVESFADLFSIDRDADTNAHR